MGWWEQEEGVLVGDGPLDILDRALQQIAAEYQEDAERHPTARELAKTLDIAIKARQDVLFGELNGMEVSEVIIKLRKAPKRQAYSVGDYVAVPLPCGGYGYVRIMDAPGRIGMLLAFLDIYSDDMLPVRVVHKAKVVREVLSDRYSVSDGTWRVIGSPVDPIAIPERSREEGTQEFDRQFDRLGGACGSGAVEIKLETALRELGRIPSQRGKG